MKRPKRIGIMGCGAIGSGLADYVHRHCQKHASIRALYDVISDKAIALEQRLGLTGVVCSSFERLIQRSDLIVEAVNAADTKILVRRIIEAKKDVLAMSVGKFLKAKALFRLAERRGCHLLFPSGAVAGLDAIKAARLAGIDRVTLTTRKPLSGLKGNPYFLKKGLDLSKITTQTILYEGSVEEAVKLFPQNINVAATIALASGMEDKLRVRLMTSPEYRRNSHEIEVHGAFGTLVTRTENVVCPDNPKTSYLAVLSGIQALKQFFETVRVGT